MCFTWENCTNKKKVDCAFGDKLGHELAWTHCKLTQAQVEKSHNFFSYNIPCDWY